ncbi:hypothetical protein AVEN_235524-1 [Araneus ventricosus]|uniref:Uncharacterized protein n=1 Tax=Araneus ventricosus TaxID=182803 RepID=A0A4Y2A4I6_ARAVE|nr:hypothetical protein AVEN_235524-1 [Araneus ventricosus]
MSVCGMEFHACCTWSEALNQHTAITGTKAEPAFIRKHNRSPLRSPMNSSLTPLTSQTRQWFGVSGMHATGRLARSCP